MTSESASILFQNAILPSADGKETVVDLLITDGKIERIATHIDSTGFKGVRIDATGMHLLPGLVDLHVHFREPGFEYKETIEGGAEAAAAGGFTTVCTMPNLNPAPDSPATLSPQLEAIAGAEKKWPVEIRPYATITMERKGREVVDFKSLETFAREAGHPLAGFSDDGSGIQEAEPMRSALESSSQGNYLIAAHCEVNSLLRGGYIHDGEWAKAHGMKGICSESEWKEIERDIDLLRQTGGRLHICHVSTKESIALIAKAKKEGLHITCETAPHYIAFCEDDLEDDGR
ncbi:MAG: amidohydrolase family protein, partial [Muribaculaceae bacterium]|nr:amidohydrolase family protein [Muribaculaceae bacterium]